MPKVKLSNHKIFDVSSDATILSEGRSRGVLLEHSCRTGRCGVCIARVLEGQTQSIQPEDALTEQEMASGCILTCCRAAVTDVELDIEDLGRLGAIAIKTLPCRIDQLELATDDVVRVHLRLPPTADFEYVAGQYIDVIGPGGVRRSYSIANRRQAGKGLELHVRKVAEGVMSRYWFSQASLNDLLRFEGPLGTFSFRENDAATIIFLATGTGIAPVKAILEDLSHAPELTNGKEIRVYWGGRRQKDLYQALDFPELNLKVLPVLSQPDTNWSGRKGYVQDCVIEDGVRLEDAVVYACGSDAMIHAARELLVAGGLNKKRFYSDAFVSSN